MAREQIRTTYASVKNQEYPFLGFYVCPDYDSAYKNNVLKAYGLSKKDYRSNGVFFPKNAKKIDAINMFLSVTHQINDLLEKVLIRTRSGNASRFELDFDSANNSDFIDIETVYWPTFGRCYNLGFKNHILSLGVMHVDISVRSDVFIYLTHPGQFYHINSRTKVIKMNETATKIILIEINKTLKLHILLI